MLVGFGYLLELLEIGNKLFIVDMIDDGLWWYLELGESEWIGYCWVLEKLEYLIEFD